MIFSNRSLWALQTAQVWAWAGIWLSSLALSALGLLWLHRLHGQADAGWPFPGRSLLQSCLLAAVVPSVVTYLVWSGRERRRERQGMSDASFGRPLWVRGLKLPFFALVTLIPLLTSQSRVRPDWPGLALCLAWMYAAYMALLWCHARLPEPTPAGPRLLLPKTSVKEQGGGRAARRVLSLAVANEREIVFRHSRANRIGVFLFAMVPLAVAVFSLMGALADVRYGASAVVLVPGYGFFTLVLLSGAGPNEMRFDLTHCTYRLRRYKPLPGRWATTWGMGVPFWEQETRGPLDDILRLELQGVPSKHGRIYCLHVVWKDSLRAPAFLSVLHSQAEAEALMTQVASAAGVPAFAGN